MDEVRGCRADERIRRNGSQFVAHQFRGRLSRLAAQVPIADYSQQLLPRTADEHVPNMRLPHLFFDMLPRSPGRHRNHFRRHEVPHGELIPEQNRGILREQPQEVLPLVAEALGKRGQLGLDLRNRLRDAARASATQQEPAKTDYPGAEGKRPPRRQCNSISVVGCRREMRLPSAGRTPAADRIIGG